jgi:Fe-S-cluster-containing hydrogenase component 2
VNDCPEHALKSTDDAAQRVLEYTPSSCVLCGRCVAVCPENAAWLRHTFGFRDLVHRFGGERLHRAAMLECRNCGETFAPLTQVEEVQKKTTQEILHLCERCKRERIARGKLLSV